MRWLLQIVFILNIFFLNLSTSIFAAEVTNLKTQFTNSEMLIEYDLLGKSGEKESSVELMLNINGKSYSTNMLSMSGDFGRSVLLGKKRRIIWLHPQDFTEGLDAKFKCIVNSIPSSNIINEGITPSEGFRASYYAVNKQTIVETRTKLMWTRNANITIKPMQYSEAEKQIKKLNLDRYAGYNDWRMPTREDFEGLVFFGKKAGWGNEFAHFIADYLVACGFTQVQPGNYWTGTKSEESRNRFIVANTWNGNMRPLVGINYYYLWPVRTAR